jgi:head-tail adaptor
MGFKGGAGALDRRITLQRIPDANTETPDSFGEVTAEPEDFLTCIPAAFEPVGVGQRGSEFKESEKRNAETIARFRIRYRRDIDPQKAPSTLRLLYIEDYRSDPQVVREFDIHYVAVIGRFEELHLHVGEVR